MKKYWRRVVGRLQILQMLGMLTLLQPGDVLVSPGRLVEAGEKVERH
jgi:hypothetical protein